MIAAFAWIASQPVFPVEAHEKITERPATPSRIVSLAPSVTETLYALGLGDAVAGVTSFCVFPPQARAKPTVGGYVNPSYEAVFALNPDLVIGLPEHADILARLSRAGLRTLGVRQGGIEEILASIETVGAACGRTSRARQLARDTRARVERVHASTSGAYRPRVLVCVGNNMGSEGITDIFVAGKGSFHHELLLLAGARNAFAGQGPYRGVSLEAILAMDPDVIIDMVPEQGMRPASRREILSSWKRLSALGAVRHGRVYVMAKDYAVIPGPRFVDLLEDMADVIHQKGAGNGRP